MRLQHRRLKDEGGEVGHCVDWKTSAGEQREKIRNPAKSVFYALVPRRLTNIKHVKKVIK